MSTDPVDPKHPVSPATEDPPVQPTGDEPPAESSELSTPAGDTTAASLPEYESPASLRSRERRDSHNMLPPRDRRRSGVERLLVRLIATAGIVAIGVAIAAIMVSKNSQGWVVGLVVSVVSVVLAAVLWSSKQL